MEYKLGPLYVLDSLQGISEIDAFFFENKKNQFQRVKIEMTIDDLGLSNEGIYYTFDGKTYVGAKNERPSMKSLLENRLDIPGIKWTIYKEEKFENGAPDSILRGESPVKEDNKYTEQQQIEKEKL